MRLRQAGSSAFGSVLSKRVRRIAKGVKKRQLGTQKRLFGLKRGQKTGFAVTDSSTRQKCKLLIYCKLQGIKWSKKDFHREGGWGSDEIREKKQRI
jgi:hypothetical protein